MKKITKKQNKLFLWSMFIGFLVLPFLLPNNIMEYAWVRWTVDLVSPILPIAGNLASNPDAHPVLPFYYALLGMFSYFLIVYLFFVENAGIGLGELSVPPPKISRRRILWNRAVFCFALLFMLLGWWAMLNSGEQERYYGRSAMFVSLFGSAIMANALFFAMPFIIQAVIRGIFIFFTIKETTQEE